MSKVPLCKHGIIIGNINPCKDFNYVTMYKEKL